MTCRPKSVSNMEVFSGTAHRNLGEEIASCLNTNLGSLEVSRFPDGEIHVRIEKSVRGMDVFVIQPTCPPVNENFTELLIILDALHRASAGRITAVIPYYGYARQDKRAAGREPITARMIADMLITGGADRILTVDLHSPQIQGFFDIPVDHLTAVDLLSKEMSQWDLSDSVLVAPDAGRVKMTTEYANRLNLPVVIVHKRRIGADQTAVLYVVGDVKGMRPIIIDDMITTGGTVSKCVDALIEEGAKPDVRVVATHPILVGSAADLLSRKEIVEVLVSNTVPTTMSRELRSLRVASIAPVIADALLRIHCDDSVSELFVQ